ncbi:hypothetical protein [Bordetella genomosp. 11]|uniref:Uncharacterized protein n=1 Tax=Bordetella genomosp. 11 TaxID=1416808 RepID=A0A261UI30_9BORD|nr:hypothetical protein [Bordetella genomosp. 11]OZI61255.1 hypothetical protein CAL28_18175 [Bordetella genomosp. 11]
MAIDGEPKDGDYVRYIEKLVNRGQAAPGQVLGKAGHAGPSPLPPPSPGEVVRDAPPAARRPAAAWGRGAASATPASAPSRDTAPPAQDTLAARAGKRRGALAVTIVGLAIAWQALRMLFQALRQPEFDPQDLVPVAFLLIFAGMLWRAARSQRTRAGQPPARLPPLTTIAKHEPGKPAR